MSSSTLLQVTNEYGVRKVCCEAHSAFYVEHIVGAVVSPLQGETGTCQRCEQDQRTAEVPARVRAALLSEKLSHTRCVFTGSIAIYHRDDTSPTGVMQAAYCDAALFEQIAADIKLQSCFSPLSPTER